MPLLTRAEAVATALVALGVWRLLVCELGTLLTPHSVASLAAVGAIHVALALSTLASSFVLPADYGKLLDVEPWWRLRPSVAWFVQEAPTLIAPTLYLATSFRAGRAEWVSSPLSVGNAPLLLFGAHYAHRVLVYPFAMTSRKPVSFKIVALAAAYCCFNGRLQCAAADLVVTSAAATGTTTRWTPSSTFLAVGGACVFALGMAINLRADYALIALKRSPRPGGVATTRKDPTPNADGYSIPHRFLFDYVASPNYLGEVVEWWGYALAATGTSAAATGCDAGLGALLAAPWYCLWQAAASARSASDFEHQFVAPLGVVGAASLAASSFAMFTTLFLVPRALQTRNFYLKRFGRQYAVLNRKAIFPFVL